MPRDHISSLLHIEQSILNASSGKIQLKANLLFPLLNHQESHLFTYRNHPNIYSVAHLAIYSRQAPNLAK